MKEYPATSRQFKVNGKEYKMRKLTLGLQADIEDEDVTVTYEDVILCSTDMTKDDLRDLDADQFEDIFQDIQSFTYTPSEGEGGEPKKPSS